jgi:hypothetical protein
MRPLLQLIRCLAVLAALGIVSGPALAHGGHVHSDHPAAAATAPVKAEKAGLAAIQAELRSAPTKLPAVAISVACDGDEHGCCPGPCAACGGFVPPSLPTSAPPTLSTVLPVFDTLPLTGLRPDGIRKPPKSFA